MHTDIPSSSRWAFWSVSQRRVEDDGPLTAPALAHPTQGHIQLLLALRAAPSPPSPNLRMSLCGAMLASISLSPSLCLSVALSLPLSLSLSCALAYIRLTRPSRCMQARVRRPCDMILRADTLSQSNTRARFPERELPYLPSETPTHMSI